MPDDGRCSRTELQSQLAWLLPKFAPFALGLTRSRADADDLLQAACERALTRVDQWHPDTRLDGWFYRIMQTVWLNEIRFRKVRQRYQQSERVEVEPADNGERGVESRILLKRVSTEMMSLAPEQQAVLILVCVEGLSYKEAAEVLDVPIGTVMSRLSRARGALSRRLEKRRPRSDALIQLAAGCAG